MSFVHCMVFVIVALTIHSIPHESKKQVKQEEIDLDDLDSEPPTEIPAGHTDIFHLNVGGEIIATTRQTLMKIPKSTLSILFNGDWENRLSKDPNGNIFFDFNPTLFRDLLDQLQVLEFDSSVHLYPPFQPSLVELFIKMLRKLGLEQYLSPEKKNVITFNVGGQTITTQRTAFTQVSHSIFDTIVPSTKTMSLSGESDAFIDYDPKLFRYLINQLRQNSLRKNAISGLASKEEKLAFERMLNDFNIFVGASETTKSTVSTTSATTESVLYTTSIVREHLRIVAPDMAEGDYVEIQCEGASPDDEARIQWFFNNRLVNDEQPLYPRGKTLHIRPISRPYLGNYRCSIPGSSFADANSVLTFGGPVVPPTSPPYYPTPAVTGRCNIDEATCRNGRCIPRAFLYNGRDDCGDGSDEAGPSGLGDGCQPSEIRCTNADRGRKCIQKFWMCDGDRDCDDGSDEDARYCELLLRQRYCKPSEFHCGGFNATTSNPVCIRRSFQCDGYNECPDRSDELGCVKPTAILPLQRLTEINAGQTVVLQCTARGTPIPYINWRLNLGHVCVDGSDNGRCTITQAIDPNDPTLISGTLTVRNVTVADDGAYSCEALNNQGFSFAIPDALVNVTSRLHFI